MLVTVRFLNYNTEYSYAPPQEDALVNLDDIVSVMPTEARGSGPFVRIDLRDGSHLIAVGTVEKFFSPANLTERK